MLFLVNVLLSQCQCALAQFAHALSIMENLFNAACSLQLGIVTNHSIISMLEIDIMKGVNRGYRVCQWVYGDF